jgi:hypothetical protein
MIRAMLRMFGLVDAEADSAKYEPAFGLPRQSLDQWLSRHPSMRERYDAELARASKRRPRNYKEDRNETSRPRAPPDAGNSLRI